MREHMVPILLSACALRGRRLAVLTATLLLIAGCWSSKSPSQDVQPSVSLALRTSGPLDMSRLAYQDACGNGQAFALGPALGEAFTEAAARDFTLIQETGGAAGPAADRRVAVDLTVGEMILFVAKDTPGEYPVSIALAVAVAAQDAAGRLLEEQELHTEVSGTVRAQAGRCAIQGLERFAEEAVGRLAEDFGRYLTSSQAVARGTVAPGVARGGAGALAFRARLTDQNGDRILESEETITLEMEVTNVGGAVVRGVEAVVTGSLELLPPLPPRILLGDLQPGESRRHQVTARLVPVAHAGQLELIVAVGAPSAGAQPSSRKRFVVTVRPKQTAQAWRPGSMTPPGRNRIDSVKGS